MNLVDKYFHFPVTSPHIKQRGVAIALALTGVLLPGLHKFYLGQRRWGIVYLLLWPTHIPQVASVVEGLWYGLLAQDEFDYNFNPSPAHQAAQQSVHPVENAPSPSSPSSLSSNVASKPSTRKSTVRSRIQSDPTYRLQTLEDVAIAAELGVAIDVNRATESDWFRLPILTEDQGRSLTALSQSGVQFHCLDDIAAALNLPAQHLKPLEPILKFYYYDTDDLTAPTPINPNQASIAALANIPGMTITLALQIIHHRTSRPFKDLADLQKRLSLSAETVEALMHYVHF